MCSESIFFRYVPNLFGAYGRLQNPCCLITFIAKSSGCLDNLVPFRFQLFVKHFQQCFPIRDFRSNNRIYHLGKKA